MGKLKWRASFILAQVTISLHGIEAAHVKKFTNRPMTTDAPPEEYIFTLGGTQNVGGQEISNGNVNPEVSLPWGFNGWAPQTSLDGGGWWFFSESHNLYGIRCTKQPSPWIGDYGNFRIMTHVVDPDHEGVSEYSPYDPKKTDWSPYHFQTNLLAYGTTTGYTSIEVTPTTHGALLRAKFPPYADGLTDATFNQTRRLMFALDNPTTDSLSISRDDENNQVVVQGYSTANNGGVASNFKHYFYATISSEDNTALTLVSSTTGTADGQLWGYIDLDQQYSNSETMIIRVATSLISADQAMFNWADEVEGVDFDEAVTSAKAVWNEEMSRVAVTDVGDYDDAVDKLTVFYSTLYRAAKYPRTMWETDLNSGSDVHWYAYCIFGLTTVLLDV
jgi:putative alpha-1,2-mannosidase